MNNADIINWWVGLWRKEEQHGTEVAFLGDFDPGQETQKDKPSPHSSYTTDELYTIAQKAFTPRKHWVVGVANTNSMEPLFDDNSIIVLERLDKTMLEKQPLRSGDIVIYESGARSIIHRLIKPYDNNGVPSWTIKGDNNFLIDGIIATDRITHRLVGILYGRERRSND